MRYGVAMASLYGHPNTDIKAGSKEVNRLFNLAASRIPYYNIGKPASRDEEIAHSLKVLKILKKHVTKDVIEADRRYRESMRSEQE